MYIKLYEYLNRNSKKTNIQEKIKKSNRCWATRETKNLLRVKCATCTKRVISTHNTLTHYTVRLNNQYVHMFAAQTY